MTRHNEAFQVCNIVIYYAAVVLYLYIMSYYTVNTAFSVVNTLVHYSFTVRIVNTLIVLTLNTGDDSGCLDHFSRPG